MFYVATYLQLLFALENVKKFLFADHSSSIFFILISNEINEEMKTPLAINKYSIEAQHDLAFDEFCAHQNSYIKNFHEYIFRHPL